MLKRKRRKENKEIRTKNRKGAPGREKGPQVVTWRPGSGRAFAPARKLVRGVPALALQAHASGSQTPVWERFVCETPFRASTWGAEPEFRKRAFANRSLGT